VDILTELYTRIQLQLRKCQNHSTIENNRIMRVYNHS